jgi:preprotein translocase subunit SecG
MYVVVLIIHVIVCFVLIMVVLLQAGRGGGFSDMLGGGQPQSLFGTQTNAFMMKATDACAVVFIITSLSLGLMSSHKGRSLIPHNVTTTQDSQPKIPALPPLPAEADKK